MTYNTYIGFEHLEKLNTATSLSFDVETCQLQPELGKLRLLQLGSAARRTVVVIDLFTLDDSQLETLERFFQNGERFWLAHNAVFDLGWLQEYGIHPRGQVHCSQLASKLLNNGKTNTSNRLIDVARKYLGVELDKSQQKSNWGGELSEEQIRYAAKDVEVLCELDAVIHKEIMDAQLGKAYSLECKALKAMAQMQRTGLYWDIEELKKVQENYRQDVENLEREFLIQLDDGLPEGEKLPRDEDGSFNTRKKTSGSVKLGTKVYAGFNMGSPTQLLQKFTLLLGKAPRDPKTDKASTARPALKKHAGDHVAVATYLNWRRSEKRRQMCKTLMEKADAQGYVKASYFQLGADTGRMTCNSPNLQQIPRDPEFRQCVKAPEGWTLIDADFSQMELKLAAVIAKDEAMMQAFIEGQDLHTATADALGCDRQIAKSANFGLLYGAGAEGLRHYAAGMGVQITQEEAATVRSKWLSTYKGISAWHKKLSAESDKRKSALPEIRVPVSGMRRYLVQGYDKLTIRANTPVQGAGAAILKCTLGMLWEHLYVASEDTVRICACVHDEVILMVREPYAQTYATLLKKCMEDAEAKWLGDVPAVADVNIADTWYAAH